MDQNTSDSVVLPNTIMMKSCIRLVKYVLVELVMLSLFWNILLIDESLSYVYVLF